MKKRFKETVSSFINNEYIYCCLVIVILIFAIGIRAFHFGIVPVGIHQDEAMMAIDSRAIEQYGTDHFGTTLPVHFEAWVGGQQSAFLDYCIALSIHLFGYNIVSIRLPMLILSAVGMVSFFLLMLWFGRSEALVGTIMLAINPWHYMQSRWAFDCNAFPHLFLIAVTLLLWAFPRNRNGNANKFCLYFSMVFFGLAHYGYGIANYTVPVFLLAASIWFLSKKLVNWKDVLACIFIYLLIALPEIMTMVINTFGWETFKWGPFTVQNFPNTFRSRDILLFTFSLDQLKSNVVSFWAVIFANGDESITNVIGNIGPLYYFTVFFVIIGFAVFFTKRKGSTEEGKTIGIRLILYWLLAATFAGLITNGVSVNRINIIFYALIAVASLGISGIVQKLNWLIIPVGGLYLASFGGFILTYYGEYAEQTRFYFADEYVQALELASGMECDVFVIDPNPIGRDQTGKIITLYVHDIDAKYFQGKTNVLHGEAVLPYAERYRYLSVDEEVLTTYEADLEHRYVYVVTADKEGLFEDELYDKQFIYNNYYVISKKE